jgi:hypothetical protein
VEPALATEERRGIEQRAPRRPGVTVPSHGDVEALPDHAVDHDADAGLGVERPAQQRHLRQRV